MVAAKMLKREVDDLSLGLAADDLAALACDLPGHGLVSRAIVGSRPFAYVGGKVGARLERADDTYVQLCGRFVVELRRPPRRAALPQPAGSRALRVPRAPTAARSRAWRADRGDLGRRPARQPCLGAHRAAVKAARRRGGGHPRRSRQCVRRLPPDARVDVEQALAALHRAESAVVQGEWARAWSAALCARYVTARPLLPGHDDLPWLDLWRRRLDDALDGALEAYAAACLGLGGTEIAGAERAARRLLEHNPLRETGYGLLSRPSLRAATWPKRSPFTSAHARCCATSSVSRPAPPSTKSTQHCSAATTEPPKRPAEAEARPSKAPSAGKLETSAKGS